MQMKPQLVTEIEKLKTDASHVLAEIVNLSSQIRDSGAEATSDLGGILPEHLKEKIDGMRSSIKTIKEELSQHAKGIDKQLKTNPYVYIAMAVAMGFALGKLQAHRRES